MPRDPAPRHRPPVRAALRTLAAIAAVAAALTALGAPARATIVRDDCLVEAPDRDRPALQPRPAPQPPPAGRKRRAPAPGPDDRAVLKVAAPTAPPAAAIPPATRRKVPIDCAPTPGGDRQARAGAAAQGGGRSVGAGAHIS